MAPKNQTIRQKIISLLEQREMTVKELSRQAGVMEKDVGFHLESIEKSLRNQKKKLHVSPCCCLKCEFEFNRKSMFKRPGKCPSCRSERISLALYRIERI